jgi:hypothetical protein
MEIHDYCIIVGMRVRYCIEDGYMYRPRENSNSNGWTAQRWCQPTYKYINNIGTHTLTFRSRNGSTANDKTGLEVEG